MEDVGKQMGMRIQAKSNEAKNLVTLMGGHRIDADNFNVRKASMRTSTAAALGERTELYMALMKDLFMIRKSLARANTTAGGFRSFE